MATEKIPQHEIDALVRTLLPAIKEYLLSDEGKREFEEWKISKGKTS
jgi:hypothetical protein